MEQIGIYEARNELSKLVQRVRDGEEFMITNRGEEMAVLTSPTKQRLQTLQTSIESMREVFNDQPPGTLDEMMAWAKEGQR